MNNLPFLKKKFGRPSQSQGEARYGFSEDDDLIEHALDEVINSIDTKDSNKFVNAIIALVNCIRSKEYQE